MSDKIININSMVKKSQKELERERLEYIQKLNIKRIADGIEGYKKRMVLYCKEDIEFLKSKGIDLYNGHFNSENKDENDYFSDLED